MNSSNFTKTVLTASFSLITLSALIISIPAPAHCDPAHSSPAIHDAMEDSIGPAFKVIAADMKAGVITAKTQLAGKTILSGFEAIEKEVPTEIPDGKGGFRPITAAEVTTFQQFNSDMLALVKILVPQLNASDVSGAQKTVQQMGDLRRKAHDQFKAD